MLRDTNDQLFKQVFFAIYRHYMQGNRTSMNFDNPVYRKTTEDQFTLEKNNYVHTSRIYPSAIDDEVSFLTFSFDNIQYS